MRITSKYPMIPVEDALNIVLNQCPNPIIILKNINDSLGFVLAEDVIANDPLPPFPASIMDGFAVISSDLPGILPVIGTGSAGFVPEWSLSNGMVSRITTGAPLPKGADAVVKVEDTLLLDEKDCEGREQIKFSDECITGKFVRKVGSDVKAGEIVVEKGTLIGVAEVGLMATVGISFINVFKPPKVAILSTGDEVIPVNEKPGPGQIRDSNKSTLISALRFFTRGIMTNYYIDEGIVGDKEGVLGDTILKALESADVLITSGGVSMGVKDLLKPWLEEHGTVHFGRLLMKPGKPTTFATMETTINEDEDDDGILKKKKKLIFALPGNPVSSLVSAQLLVIPAIRKMAGWEYPLLPKIQVKLGHDFKLDKFRADYQRVKLIWNNGRKKGKEDTIDDDNINIIGHYVATSTGMQRSSRLLSMQSADALLCLPIGEGILPTGSVVTAILLGNRY